MTISIITNIFLLEYLPYILLNILLYYFKQIIKFLIRRDNYKVISNIIKEIRILDWEIVL